MIAGHGLVPWDVLHQGLERQTGIAIGATGMYIGAALGPGPRDGLMTGFARRSGRSLRLVRTAIEATVLLLGWFLGGTIGIGTVVDLLAIGPVAYIFVPFFTRAATGASSCSQPISG